MPSNTVGGVSVTVRLDDKDALAQLANLRRKIEDAQKALAEKRAKRDELGKQAEAAAQKYNELAETAASALERVNAARAAIDNAPPKDQLQYYREELAEANKELTAANRELKKQETQVNRIAAAQAKLDQEIAASESQVSSMTTQATGLERQVRAGSGAMNTLRAAAANATRAMQRGFSRVGRMIKRVFLFSMITRGLRALRSYFGDLFMSFPEIRDALASIKGNLLTAAQPFFERLIPIVQTLLSLLVQVSAVLAEIVSKIFGTTAAEAQAGAKALNEQVDAYKATGSAAKKAARQLASFDELNVLSDNSSGGGSSSGSSPSFDTDFSSKFGGMLEGLELMTGIALLAIGAILTFTGVNIPLGITLMALGAASMYAALTGNPDALKQAIEGKIGDFLVLTSLALLVLGTILAFSGASIPLGIALMVIGAAGLVAVVATNWDAIKEKLQGPLGTILAIVSAALLVLGAVLAFSGAAIPLGIALMVIGAAGLAAVAIVNWDTIKKALQGPLGEILAIVSAALLVLGAVLTFTGAAVPLGIGLMIVGAAGLAAVAAVNWDAIVEALRGPIGLITAIVSAALLVLGAVLTFSGAAIPLGIGLMIVGASGLATVAAVNWDKIKALLTGEYAWIIALISGALLVLGVILVVAGIIPLGIALIIAGAAGLVTVTALNWDSIKEKIVGVWDSIKTWWNTHVAPIFTADWWAEKFASISEGLERKVKDGVNIAIDLFNRFIDWINDRLNISWEGLSLFGAEIIKAGSYQLVTLPRIPRLAEGAVIPPNREFMAVLGDQKSGTNIEAPLQTMVDAFRQALNEGGYGDAVVNLYLDGEKIASNTVKHINRSNRAGGRLSIV